MCVYFEMLGSGTNITGFCWVPFCLKKLIQSDQLETEKGNLMMLTKLKRSFFYKKKRQDLFLLS